MATMLSKTLCVLLCFKIVLAQINGEFWWLNEKLRKFHGNKVQPPEFEELSVFDNDENDKIVFRNKAQDNDNGLQSPNNRLPVLDKAKGGDKFKIEFPNFSFYPMMQNMTSEKLVILNDSSEEINTSNVSEKVNASNKIDDEFVFNFPDETELPDTQSNISETMNESLFNTSNVSSKITFRPNNLFYNAQSETICTYISETSCTQRNGSIYWNNNRSDEKRNLICCILPLKPETKMSTIFFPGSRKTNIKRVTRSTQTDDFRKVLNQGKSLLILKYINKLQNNKPTYQPQVTQRIVSSDEDYEDPYANIRNPVLNTPNNHKNPIYGVPDYDSGYTEELPRPGLIGLYSDHEQEEGGWSFANDDDVGDEENDGEVGYGFTTVDPRFDNRNKVTTKSVKRRIPILFTSSSEETSYETGSQTISYQSNPDFQVLQGFKLFNHNKSSIYTNKATTESINEDSQDTDIIETYNSEYDDFIDTDTQVFQECGKTLKDQTYRDSRSEAASTSSPWLSLVERARRHRRTLCHATLVHPRAVVTAATCVYGAAPGEVTVHAGVWDLQEDRKKLSQRRMSSVHLHPRYTPRELANDLAILHWHRPLRLGPKVQPACLADPHIGDSCSFVGWGARSEVAQARPRRQRGNLMTPRECSRFVTTNRATKIPKDAFCASVESQGCVTGIGGALICTSNGRHAAVGVVVRTDRCDVTTPAILIPVHEWIRTALSGLGIA